MGKRGPAPRPLTNIQRFAAFRLVYRQGLTMEQVAEEAGVSRMTLWKWQQREDFAKAYEQEYRNMVQRFRYNRRA
ncbi:MULTISPECIES: phBC6A51 family helix-turn-helix protein [unclassified Peribacillus]|uniref:phBC6A51 family helix-turn-helix protein n=1 Tax=unclassified Peribacillus TaxID=2675266 RepID=UPI00366DFD07